MNIQKAVEKIQETLKEDKEYRDVWKANIAMAFQDEFKDWVQNKVGRNAAPDHIHKIANGAADRFIDNLIQ
jgi:uncharacterized protein YukE